MCLTPLWEHFLPDTPCLLEAAWSSHQPTPVAPPAWASEQRQPLLCSCQMDLGVSPSLVKPADFLLQGAGSVGAGMLLPLHVWEDEESASCTHTLNFDLL